MCFLVYISEKLNWSLTRTLTHHNCELQHYLKKKAVIEKITFSQQTEYLQELSFVPVALCKSLV